MCYNLETVQTELGRDLVDEAIPDTFAYKEKVSNMIWAMYRFAVLNSCDLDRWVRRASDKSTLLDNRFTVIMEAYEELRATGQLNSLSSESSETETRDLTGTVSRSTSREDTSTQNDTATTENLPEYLNADSGVFLTSRDKNTSTGTLGSNGTERGSTTDSGTVKRVHVDRLGLIPSEMLERMKNALYDPYYEYAKQWDDLFVRLWADEGCYI